MAQWISRHRFLIGYSVLAGLFLLFLNLCLWPAPDEYYYASIAYSFTAAQHGLMHWWDINTEHLWVLSSLVWVLQQVWQPEWFWGNRLVVIPFAIGIIWLIAAISRLTLPKEHHHWLLWLLLLIPGFWIFSVRLMLDIPATFAIALLLYFLTARRSSLYVSAALVLLFVFREYYVYLILPYILCLYFIDAFRTEQSWSRAFGRWLMQAVIVTLPIFCLVVLFLDFNLLPYPRLLENSLIFIFGDLFRWLNYHAVLLLDRFVHIVYPEVTLFPPVSTVVTTGSTLTPDTIGTSLQLSGQIPTGIIDSPIDANAVSLWSKLWLIYYYNFSEADLNIFLLPFAALGILLRLGAVWKQWRKKYLAIRVDIIFFLLLGMFAYFNYHEATSEHGFRITLPIILGLLYFAYWGAAQLLTSPKLWQQIFFVAGMALSLVGYWATLQAVQYGSVLAHESILSQLLAYKPYLFMGLFVVITIGVVLYTRWQWVYKRWLPPVLITLLFIVKFIPFGLEAKESTAVYGYDYGLPQAAEVLHQVMTPDKKICGNLHAYRSQYYAQDPFITNAGIYPIIRTFTTQYPERYTRCAFDSDLITTLVSQGINYVFVLNEDINQTDYQAWQTIQNANPERFTLLTERTLNGRVQWQLYQVN
jgi:hypothetical protein